MLCAKVTHIFFKHKERKKITNQMMPAFSKMALLFEEKKSRDIQGSIAPRIND